MNKKNQRHRLQKMTSTGIVIFFVLIVVAELGILLQMRKTSNTLSKGTLREGDISIEEFRGAELSVQGRMLDEMSSVKNFAAIKDFIKSAYPDEPPHKHELAHKLGGIAFKEFSFDAFGFCDTLLNYGCFHGAAFAAIRRHGLDPQLGDKLWLGCKKNTPNPGRCLHGLGHAIMILKQYDLLAAYHECERSLNENDSFWCQDGATMENITRTMADTGLEPYGSDADPYYPCNALPKKHEAVCARNHLQYAQNRFSFDLAESIKFCLGFYTQRAREECIGIMGSLTADDFFTNPELVIEHCKKTAPYVRFCIEGGANVFATAKQYNRAGQLCATLEAPGERDSCLGIISSFNPQ